MSMSLEDEWLSRLEILKNKLGIEFSLTDPVPEDEAFVGLADECSKGTVEGADEHFGDEACPKACLQDLGGPSKPVIKETPFVPPFDCSNFRVGECLGADVDFCSWKAIQAYPENFIGNTNRPRAKPFFDKILEERVWDFFYLFHPQRPEEGARLVVPSLQFEAFLHSINKKLGTCLAIPGGVNQDQFYLRFGKGGAPRPRYLKRTRDEKALKLKLMPEVDEEDVEAFRCVTPTVQEDWKKQWRLLIPRPARADKKKNQLMKAAQRGADRWRMLNDVQQYLHLTGKYLFDVVFVSMDVEALELPPHPISEVGVSILDVERIRQVPSGPSGQDWWQFIEAHHIRVKEYAGLVNHRYVKGCPDDFDFGTSIFSSKGDIAKNINEILAKYIDQGRRLVFVGHEVASDLNYLSRVGFDVIGMKSFFRQLDTKAIHQAWKGSDNGRSLEGILSELCIPSEHLHNAGNDAAYTLRALLGIAIEQPREIDAMVRGQEYVPSLFAADS